MVNQAEVSEWAKAVGQWVGDSPYKAATFAAVVFVIGLVVGLNL